MTVVGSRHAPKAMTVYASAVVVAIAITMLAAWQFDMFVPDPHPDPTRGSVTTLLVVLLGMVALVGCSSLFVIIRWLLWPAARNRAWNLQASLSVAAAVVAAAVLFGFPIL